MKKLKSLIKNVVNDFPNKVKDTISPVLFQINRKYKIPQRKRLLNRWGTKNPKKLIAYFFLCMLSIIAINIIFSVASINKTKEIDNQNFKFSLVDNIIHNRRKIDNKNEKIKSDYLSIIQKGTYLNHRLDSLNKLPYKTRNDTIEILTLVKQLNTISNILAHEEN